MKLKILITVLVLLTICISGCGQGIPTRDVAPYEISSTKYGSGYYIYSATYEIKDSLLYLDKY